MVGVVAQHYPLFAHRTVLGNLTVAGRQAGCRRRRRRESGRPSPAVRDGGARAQVPVSAVGGQRQRVAIAQQFMCSEHFLLMDEPFSGLDLNAVDRVSAFITEMARSDEHKTFIVVTHDVDAALEVSDTIWLLGRDRDAQDRIIPGGAHPALVQPDRPRSRLARGHRHHPGIPRAAPRDPRNLPPPVTPAGAAL
jgi:polar amino acid transport system ATP-binding protein/sulfate transport system ATP-binding protein